MSLTRAGRFLQKVLIIFLILACIGGILVGLQLLFHPFDDLIATLDSWVAQANSLASQDLLAGISLGMLVLVLLVFALPLFMKKVDRRQYLVASQRGVLASVVFFFTQLLYEWADSFSRFYLVLAIVAVAVLTFVVIETLSLLMRQEEEKGFRTDLIASIASGLVAGVVIKVLTMVVAP